MRPSWPVCVTSQQSEPARSPPRERLRHLPDAVVVLLGVLTWWGASNPADRPLLLLGLALIACLLARRPILMLVVVPLLAQGLCQHALGGMRVEVGHDVEGSLELLSDPRPDELGGQWKAQVRHGGKRWLLVVDSDLLNDEFREGLSGEHIHVSGSTRRLPRSARWLRQQHVVGSIEARELGSVTGSAPVASLANSLRRYIVEGAEPLGQRHQALFSGFVLGDDRFQSPVDGASFKRSGLTHLLAVSGQNVAFVLALVSPFLRRLPLPGRLTLILTVIAVFAMMTRFEPSVLRASVMAAIAAVAAVLGRPTGSVRILGLTVTGLILLDPFLVDSLAFRLSVAASGGILLLAGPIARRLPGPRSLALAVAVTASAQLAVSPLLLATFGPVPIASVPANLLAGPASGPIMTWGMSAGIVAGLLPGTAALIHVPTRLLLGWIDLVARWIPALFPGGHDSTRLLALMSLAVLLVLLRRSSWLARTAVGALLVTVVLLPAPPGDARDWHYRVSAGVEVWVGSDGSTVVAVDGRARPERTLIALSEAGITRIDLLVQRTEGRSVIPTADAIADDRRVLWRLAPGEMSGVLTGRIGCLVIDIDDQRSRIGIAVEHAEDLGCVGPAEIASPP